MNIRRAKEEIRNTIEAYLLKDEYGEYVIPRIRQRPVLLLGAPGIGKTQIMEQIARECGIGLVAYTITHHTRQSAIGLPHIETHTYENQEYTVTEYTMSEIVAAIYSKMKKTGLKEGILFIDEINCASETLAPAMLQFLQCKTFGSHEIPQGWVIVTAGNPPEYNKSVRDFDVVTLDRVKKIEVEPDYGVWKEYALKNRLHPAIISYLNTRTANFYRMETTIDGKKFATPRGWEDLSELLLVYEGLGHTVDREVVVQYIQHEKTAADFASYLELYYKYQLDYQLEAVLAGQIDDLLLKKAAHASFDERLSVVSLLQAALGKRFAQIYQKESELTLLFEQLKELRDGQAEAPEQGGRTPAENNAIPCQEDRTPAEDGALLARLERKTESFRAEYESKKTAELLSRQEARCMCAVLETLECYAKKLREEKNPEFSMLRAWFDEAQDELEQAEKEAGETLEHVFDFMEAAFGSGQEMVIFITNLNGDFYSVRFLQHFECERYYRYNRQLLFEDSRHAIEERLRRLNG